MLLFSHYEVQTRITGAYINRLEYTITQPQVKFITQQSQINNSLAWCKHIHFIYLLHLSWEKRLSFKFSHSISHAYRIGWLLYIVFTFSYLLHSCWIISIKSTELDTIEWKMNRAFIIRPTMQSHFYRCIIVYLNFTSYGIIEIAWCKFKEKRESEKKRIGKILNGNWN